MVLFWGRTGAGPGPGHTEHPSKGAGGAHASERWPAVSSAAPTQGALSPFACGSDQASDTLAADSPANQPYLEVCVFCPNCGTQNPETASTCVKCGFNLRGAAAAKVQGHDAHEPAAARRRPRLLRRHPRPPVRRLLQVHRPLPERLPPRVRCRADNLRGSAVPWSGSHLRGSVPRPERLLARLPLAPRLGPQTSAAPPVRRPPAAPA